MKRIVASALIFVWGTLVFAEGPQIKQRPAEKEASKSSTSQPVDTEYTDSIIKNTTDKMFLTEIVDHLPASAKVPTPAKILGYPVGTPNKLTYTADLYRYYRELEKATPRVKTFVAPEKREQGREQMLVAVSAEANLAKLARYNEITAKLADPRTTHDDFAKPLIAAGSITDCD